MHLINFQTEKHSDTFTVRVIGNSLGRHKKSVIVMLLPYIKKKCYCILFTFSCLFVLFGGVISQIGEHKTGTCNAGFVCNALEESAIRYDLQANNS